MNILKLHNCMSSVSPGISGEHFHPKQDPIENINGGVTFFKQFSASNFANFIIGSANSSPTKVPSPPQNMDY